MSARLVTICFSHYCDKARWALEKRGVDFVEDGHLPMFSWLHTFGRGGGRTTPVLITHAPDKLVLDDSTDIVRWADEHGTQGAKLLDDPEAEKLEEEFDVKLGPHTRRMAYFALLPDRDAILRMVHSAPVPRHEKVIARNAVNLMRRMLTKGLNVTAEATARSDAYARAVFDDVEQRLKDGRKYLCGDHFTAADLTFAALSAPVIYPDAYARTLLPFDQIPEASKALVTHWRDSVAGRFALRMYENDR